MEEELSLPSSISHGLLGMCAVDGALRCSEAAKLMRAQRASAVIITEDTPTGASVRGLFTERDVVTRVVARGRSPAETRVEEVMTPSPRCIDPQCDPLRALEMMHEHKFRHLPIVTSAGALVGMMDVVKLVREMVNGDVGPAPAAQPAAATPQGRVGALSWISDSFSYLWSGSGAENGGAASTPTRVRLHRSLLDVEGFEDSMVCCVATDVSAFEIASLMTEHRVSAVLVTQDEAETPLVGIVTERDIVTRVVCEGSRPRDVTASAFMTPQPFTVDATIAPLEALRIMLRNHYRHLPVCFGPGEHGLVDVLSLSYGALDLDRLRARGAQDTPTRGSSVLKRLAGALSLLSRPPESMQQLAEETDTEGGVDGALLELCADEEDSSRSGKAEEGPGRGEAVASSEAPTAADDESSPAGAATSTAGDGSSCPAEEEVDPATLVRAIEAAAFAPARSAMAEGDAAAQSGDMAAAVAAYGKALEAVDAAAGSGADAPAASALGFCRATALMRRAQALTIDERSADAQTDYRAVLVIAGDEEAEGASGSVIRSSLPAGLRSAAMAGLAACLADSTWYEEAQRWALRALRLVHGGRGWEQVQGAIAGLGAQLGRELDNLKESGKELYADAEFASAMSKYTHALRVVGVLEALSEASDGAVTAPQSADGRGVPLRPVLLSNRAACYMQLQDYPMALADCRDCLRGEGRAYAKGWVRLAQCLAAMGKDRRSLGAAQRGLRECPNNAQLLSLAAQAQARLHSALPAEQPPTYNAAAGSPPATPKTSRTGLGANEPPHTARQQL